MSVNRGEPDEIELRFPGMDLINFGKANAYYWWDNTTATFRNEQISDWANLTSA